VYLKYCDGSSQTGDVDAPVPVGNSTIYYRGHRILRAVLAYLTATTLAGASDIVVSGCSAGGLSTYLHADEWAAALAETARVTALPDSGFFLDYNETGGGYTYGGLMRQIAADMNASLPARCVAAHTADPASCIFAETVATTLVTPAFALQGKYDSWQLGGGDAGINLTDTAAVNAWGALLSERIGSTLLAQPQHGAFLDSCLHHCGGFDNFVVDGFTQATAHAAWYAGGSRRLYNQTQSYPCQACCGGAVFAEVKEVGP
jgi:O-palmitoleoyl-L-serine hydrolase